LSLLGIKVESDNKELAPGVISSNFSDYKIFFDSFDEIYDFDTYKLLIVGRCLLTSFEQNDIEKALEDANGTFSYCLWLKQKDVLIFGTDKLGFYPLYYSLSSPYCFANFIFHLKPFIKVLKPNWDAWDEILNEGDVLGEKTPIKDISRLRQGEKIVLAVGQLTRKTFWEHKSPIYTDIGTYIDKNNELLTESLKVLDDERKFIPSTGGHDSRRLIATAHSLNFNFSTVTQQTSFKDNIDVDSFIAEKVAEMLNINNHQNLDMLPNNIFNLDVMYKDRWNGFESHNHGWAVNLLRHLPDSSSLYDGIIGDITINNHFITDFNQFNKHHHNVEYLMDLHIKKPRMFELKSSLLNDNHQNRLKAEIEKFDNDPNRFNLFKTFNHTRRNIGHWYSPFILHGHKINLPYAYLPLFEQSFSLVDTQRRYAEVQLQAMRLINDRVADLPSTRTHEDMNFWRQQGAPKVKYELAPISLDISPLNKETFSYLTKNFRDMIFDNIVFRIKPNDMLLKKPWRYEPLQRLQHFLTWLETDHSTLPILHKGTVPEFYK
jgi:hypothetical protein